MIIVEITVPALDDKFDFQLDETALTHMVMVEICDILCKKSNSEIPADGGQFKLASFETGLLLDDYRTLADNGIREGSHLILV